jgi:hypothetical protein
MQVRCECLALNANGGYIGLWTVNDSVAYYDDFTRPDWQVSR